MFTVRELDLKKVKSKELCGLYFQYILLEGSARKQKKLCEKEFDRRKMQKPKRTK